MTKPIKRIAVTGGAGQIAYSLLFRLANGDLLGKDQPIHLHILELKEAMQALEGVVMELQDCAFPLLEKIVIGSDPEVVFKDVDYAFLVGSKPRGPGMERKDLLEENGKIFIEQGKALNIAASRNVQVLVVGNPCNTNCLIAMHHAPNIPKTNFHAMTRLDQNRAVALLANKANVSVNQVSHMLIWGNHSSTQVPDFTLAKIENKAASKVIDKEWLTKDFIPKVQKRGAEIIAARGKSSAASAANAAIDAMRAIIEPTKTGEFFSSGVFSGNNPYRIEDNLIFSFPCTSLGNGKYEIVKDLPIDPTIAEKIKISEKELLEERELISKLLEQATS